MIGMHEAEADENSVGEERSLSGRELMLAIRLPK
jgi:hypothetical protein